MKLTEIEIRNFRSYAVASGEGNHRLEVGEGLNLLVGPNNSGKSNLLRAMALAFQDQGGEYFDSVADIPQQMAWAYPTIYLQFQCNPSTSVEGTLLRYVDEYERSAGSVRTLADRGELRFRVVYRKAGRDAGFSAGGRPRAKGDEELLERALRQFHKCVRFIYLRSGESLTNFLAGTFRELLHTVIQENLREEIDVAQAARATYLEGLRSGLLTSLEQHSLSQLSEVLNEIQKVAIQPSVPGIGETLAGADISITDGAETALVNKGTGVRGAFLVALLV